MFIISTSPADVKPIIAVVATEFPEIIEADDFRPTARPDFTPTAEEETEAAEMLNGDDEPTDADWDAMAEDAMHLEMACSGHWAF